MSVYERHVLPWLIHCAMRAKTPRQERQGLIPRAGGVVLEIGIGSGLNLPIYGPSVTGLYGIDPSPRLLALARRRAREAPFPVALLRAAAEALPLPDASVDTVVSTWTLCSVRDPTAALEELRRVLRPGGRVVFIEHGAAPDARVLAWQRRLTPVWRRWAGGCRLDSKVDALLLAAGFALADLRAGYAAGPRPLSYLYRGIAQPGDARSRAPG